MKTPTTFLAATVLAAGLALAAGPAKAAIIYAGNFSGTECGGAGGFSNCYATTTGTQQGATPGASPTVYKRESGGGQAFSNKFPTITGSEFVVSLNNATNELSFTYTPGASDPEIHYFAIKQANGFALFYDLTTAITSFTADLDTYFPGNPGFSHITFFDTNGSTTPPPPPTPVPEPASMALFGAGLLGLGLARRRRRQQA
ncbi:PEP-CTERM sorting domain-containing protein [Falsiroseomonas sp. E2-1-a20]|uniref:PEP-CTERM sorting domain-containing protein n=1 Tax=Falsiroseomonas sp. E2-1-a20 TaxID=3239300 RepID=UPI003F2F0AE9